jgi:peptidoglycan-N-acetylglucosamine deacetylase
MPAEHAERRGKKVEPQMDADGRRLLEGVSCWVFGVRGERRSGVWGQPNPPTSFPGREGGACNQYPVLNTSSPLRFGEGPGEGFPQRLNARTPERLFLIPLFFLSLCVLCASVAVPHRAGAAVGPGEQVRPFTLAVKGGGAFQWKPGRAAVLSFCAFWCDTWKEQNERLAAARKALQGLPVDFLTVSVDGRWAERGGEKIRGPVLLDPGGAFSSSLGIQAVPYTLVLDPRGRILYAAQGIVRSAAVQEVLRDLVNGEETRASGTVFLTFDDFPAGEGDDALLDLLRVHDLKATFFCIGRNIEANREVVRRAAAEGHSLQLHSWDHDPHPGEDPQHERCIRALEEAGASRPGLYRPPGRAEIVKLDGTAVPVHTVNPYDYKRPGEKELVRRVLLAAKPGSVILLHAGVSETREALPEILASLRKRGLGFGVLAD